MIAVMVFLLFQPQDFKNIARTNNTSLYEFNHPISQCLDENKERYDLKSGFAEYWQAKVVTMFSNENIVVNQLEYDLSVKPWINNTEWYDFENLHYNFIMVDELDETKIIVTFGEPEHVLTCYENENALTIYIYDDDLDKKINKDKFKQ